MHAQLHPGTLYDLDGVSVRYLLAKQTVVRVAIYRRGVAPSFVTRRTLLRTGALVFQATWAIDHSPT